MIELYAQANPVFPYMEDNFPTIAREVMRVAALPAPGYTLGLAPFGRVADKFPFGNNAGAIGHDNLDHCQVCCPSPPHPSTTEQSGASAPVSEADALVSCVHARGWSAIVRLGSAVCLRLPVRLTEQRKACGLTACGPQCEHPRNCQ